MNQISTITHYLCRVVGETPLRAARFHVSTLRRMHTFAIAIHIPVLMWAVMGYLVASRVFQQSGAIAVGISAMCAGLIYMVERIVLATPKSAAVNVIRVLIGLVISVLGASSVDLVIFEREITDQLQQTQEASLRAEHDLLLAQHQQKVEQIKADWLKAQEAANCEANGTCGSKVRSVGPVYRQLARQAEELRNDYLVAQQQLEDQRRTNREALEKWREQPTDVTRAGLLVRVQALHDYTTQNPAALIAWVFFFALMLFFELMVVFCKIVFGETVDDKIDRIREQISEFQARTYMDAVTSPVTGALAMVDASYT